MSVFCNPALCTTHAPMRGKTAITISMVEYAAGIALLGADVTGVALDRAESGHGLTWVSAM